MRRLLTTRQVADTLGCSQRYVRTLVGHGTLKAIRLQPGGVYRIYEQSVSDLCDDSDRQQQRQRDDAALDKVEQRRQRQLVRQ